MKQEGGLGGLNYPLLADFHKTIARDYGVLIESAGVALRGGWLLSTADTLMKEMSRTIRKIKLTICILATN